MAPRPLCRPCGVLLRRHAVLVCDQGAVLHWLGEQVGSVPRNADATQIQDGVTASMLEEEADRPAVWLLELCDC